MFQDAERTRPFSLEDEPVRMRHRGNSLEDMPDKSLHRLSLPAPEVRSASCDNITPLATHNSDSMKSNSNGAAFFKRAFSELTSTENQLPQQRKKISRFLSFFRKSKHSKVEFGKICYLNSC